MTTRHRFVCIAVLLLGCSASTRGPRPPLADDAGGEEEPPASTPTHHPDAAIAADAAPAMTTADAEVAPPPPADAAGPPPADGGQPAGPPAALCTAGGKKLGPPNAAELKIVDDQLRAMPLVPAGTNHGNNFAYGTAAKNLIAMRSMYGLTGDLYYLDQAIKFADYFLMTRNDPMTGRVLWTGKREPCWPNNDDTAPDAGVCGAESAQVAGQILNVAKIIAADKTIWNKTVALGDPSHYGATYLQRARTYLQECERSMDYFLAHFFSPAPENFIVTPTDPAYAALGPNYAKAQGRKMAWNQEDMVADGLALISDVLILLGEDPMRVASNDALVKAALNHFIAELKANQYMLNGVTVYKWGYNPGDLFHVEDLAHASGDINMLDKGYVRGRYGIDRATMVPMANTFFELVVKPDGTYAAHVDGKGTRPVVSNSWTNYEEFRPGIVARLQPKLTVDGMTPVPDAITILGLRKRFCSR
jgi:hypothetical protein